MEAIPNLASGALPGFPDYVPFLGDFRGQYDTPWFGKTLEIVVPLGTVRAWTLGKGKSSTTWSNQMTKRGWTDEQVTEALSANGILVRNAVNPGNPAMRHVHPTTGQSVVIDSKTNEIIHVGGKDFDYSDWDLP